MTTPTISQSPAKSTRRKRLVWIIGLGAVVIGVASFYAYFWHARPAGRGPAGPAVPGDKFEYAWTDRPVVLVGLGDSVTQGFGASPGKGYFARLVKNPPDEFPDMQGKCLLEAFPNLAERNLAISGSNSLECLENAVPKLEVQSEETFGVVVMTVGGNDIIHNYGRTPPREGAMYGATLEQARPWTENFKDRLEKIITAVEAKFPGGCQFFIANIYDPTDGVGDIEHAGLPAWRDGLHVVAAYNEAISQVVEKHSNAHVVDIYAAFLGHGIHCLQFWRTHYDARDPHYWYWDNLEDPNDRGYDVIRRLFLIEMADTLPSLLEDGD